MAVYDQAHELARAMRNSDEYQQYLKAKEKVKEKEESYRMLQQFRRLQLEAQTAQLAGQAVTDDKMQKLQEIYQILQFQPLVQEFFEAEARVIQLVADVQRILGQALDLELDLGTDADRGAQADPGDNGDGESPLWIP